MEIIFVSADRDQESFDSYFKTMPWVAIPYGLDISHLRKLHKITGYPSLPLFRIDGTLVHSNARGTITQTIENNKDLP